MKFTSIFFAFVLLATRCKKELSIPNDESKKLFGTWELYHSSGPFGQLPDTENNTIVRKYNSNGKVKGNKNGINNLRTTFTFGTFSGSYSTLDIIEYKRGKSSEHYSFRGNDTLYINPLCDDCYDLYFVRVM
jgi:hypothetical protein